MLLREVVRRIAARGWAVGNVDATLVAQAPRLGPHIPAMRGNLAADLGLPEDAVSVKATTTEGMGYTGRAEGISAHALCLLVPGGGRSAR
jgi:2-C-methyl-D-erythritol 2,4-cyclodiphosphate synthase